jgi:hypothetical protein
VSFADASFQKGYAKEPDAFCRSCHAPESKPESTPDGFARGIACVTCHLPETAGPILSGEGKGSGAAQTAPHPITRVTGFGTRACAKCHEFAFPRAEVLGASGLMQKTMTEHAASAAKDRSCASCHMPEGSHAFVASRDEKLLARALETTVVRSGDDVTITLRAKDVGHAFPTGDLFRRLLLRVRTAKGVVERPFGRVFAAKRDDEGNALRYEASDHRLVTEQRVELTSKEPLAWEVAYQRVTFLSQLPPFAATVEDEKVIARGTSLATCSPETNGNGTSNRKIRTKPPFASSVSRGPRPRRTFPGDTGRSRSRARHSSSWARAPRRAARTTSSSFRASCPTRRRSR